MSPTTHELSVESWADYFDSLAASLEGLHVTIEVMSEQEGDQLEAERLPLQTIGYDHKDKVLEIAVGGRGTRYPVVLRHFIYGPQTISVEESGLPTPSAILVTDESGARTLIGLFEPTALER
jgi:hypothetical protein